MTKEKEALKLALEALRDYRRSDDDRVSVAMGILQDALAEQPAQQQEPVAWMAPNGMVNHERIGHFKKPLYTTPPQRKEWQGLTDEEVFDTANAAPFASMVTADDYIYVLARAIEAKLKEKNT